MIDKIKDLFSNYNFLGPKELLFLAANSKLCLVKKDEFIVKQGDLSYNTITVVKGLLRHFVIDENGVEKTLLFVPEKGTSAIPDTFFHQKTSSENVQAVENSVIIKFDIRLMDQAADKNIRLLKLQNRLIKRSLMDAIEHIKFLNLLTPEERYLLFCKTYPKLEQRVKQKHLASYLGITPTSLSRVRARISAE